MSRVTIRPTVASDLPHIIGEPLPYRIKAYTAESEGKILGIGGIAFPPGGLVEAFVSATPEAKNYPVAFHRAGRMAMKMIMESKVREVIASCDADNPTACRWLKRLGFVEGDRQPVPGKLILFWTRK